MQATTRPRGNQKSAMAIVNMCIGLFGVQVVWGLHNVNTSRIFQTFGAQIDELAFLWIAAPLAGLVVQPVIGWMSDRTWTGVGRRRPYMLAGAILTAAALAAFPSATTLFTASLMLWLLISAINIVMEPFRALAADVLPEDQRNWGYAAQVLFIGLGAVFSSALPWIMEHFAGLSQLGGEGVISPAVRASYYVGAVAVLFSVLWSVFTTSEPTPDMLAHGNGARTDIVPAVSRPAAAALRGGPAFIWVAILAALANLLLDGAKELYVLAAVAGTYGLLLSFTHRLRNAGKPVPALFAIIEEIAGIPPVLRQIALVQFFSWFALFLFWIYLLPSVAALQFGTIDPTSPAYAEAAGRVSLMFAQYNGMAALFALLIPLFARRLGRRWTYCLALLAASIGLGLIGAGIARNGLGLTMLLVGIGWAAILSLPYAILAERVDPGIRGSMMGIHNIFLVLPQLVAATTVGPLLAVLPPAGGGMALLLAGASMGLSAVLTLILPSDR